MKWINIEEKKPENGSICWVCTSEKDVYDASYLYECHDYSGSILKIVPGFSDCEGDWHGGLLPDEITHWMPYYTPEPPNEEE